MSTTINKNELVVTQRNAVKKTLNMAILFIVTCLVLISKVVLMPSNNRFKFALIGILICFIIFLAMRFFQFLKLYIIKTPAMIINSEGIWIKEFGLIPWRNIADIETYNPLKVPFGFENDLNALGINLHDSKLLFANASRRGKRALTIAFNSRLPYPITLIDMDIPAHEIVTFVRQFMDIYE